MSSLAQQTLMGRLGHPDEIAHAAVFLAYPAAACITGQVLTVDGDLYCEVLHMNDICSLRPIARIRSDSTSKFGIPRQRGIVKKLTAEIVFEPEFQNPNALRSIEGFSYLWLIREFSESVRREWSPTVRPPRLGGNTRLGVFATRSPFRPNPHWLFLSQTRRRGNFNSRRPCAPRLGRRFDEWYAHFRHQTLCPIRRKRNNPIKTDFSRFLRFIFSILCSKSAPCCA